MAATSTSRRRQNRRLIYDRAVDLANLPKEYVILLEVIGQGRTVLEVGPHTGYFTELLRSRACRVTAVERDEEAAARAKLAADELLVGDIEDPGLQLPLAMADVVLFSHVLEHLVDPIGTLVRARSWLREGGRIVAAIPNIAFWRVRLDLLRGRFDYTPTGILDETHLRFFTKRTAYELFERAGYDVRLCVPGLTHAPASGRLTRIPSVGGSVAAAWARTWARWWPEATTVTFIFEACARGDAS